MKLTVIALTLLTIVGCSSLSNMNTKPESEVPKADPTKVTLTVPSWPIYGYAVNGALVLLIVKEPENFPIPERFVFKSNDGKEIIVPLIKEEKK